MNYKIGVLGDFILDKFIYYKATKLSPEGPVPIVEKISQKSIAGGAGNVALSLDNLNCEVELNYPFNLSSKKEINKKINKEIEEIFKNSSVKLQKINLEIDTPIKIRHYVDNKLFMREDEEKKYNFSKSLISDEFLKEWVRIYDVLVISDYQKGFFSTSTLQKLIFECNKNNVALFIDSKNKESGCFRDCFCLKVNKLEFNELSRSSGLFKNKELPIIDRLKILRESLNISNFIVTLGSEGSIVANQFGTSSAAAFNVEINDITGAGDAFIAALIKSTLNDSDFYSNKISNYQIKKDQLRFANEASASVIVYKGTVPIQKKFLKNKKIKAKFGKLGFTNGCFDILHKGHIALLKQAKEFCDYLIVGLNSDESVKKLKGSSRPINDQKTRMQILQSIIYVDEVIIFNELTPINLIKQISPDFLIKGADYNQEEIIGADYVQSYGGKLIIADLVKNISSTKLIKKIKNN